MLNISFSGSSPYDTYELYGAINGSDTNSFLFTPYDSENIGTATEKQVELMSISGATVSYPALVIRNVLGKKELYGSGITLDKLDSATLTFEKNGKEIIVTIGK